MPVLFEQTRQEKLEVMLWIGGQGPETPAVRKAIVRMYLTFGIALITRSAENCNGRYNLN